MAGSNSLAVLSVAFLIPIYNLTAVIVLLVGRTGDAGRGPYGKENVDCHAH